MVKRSIRTDKRKYVEDLAMTAEKTTRDNCMTNRNSLEFTVNQNDK
ncbi:unnamed protein product [Schistosoma margrebowiei]|uniref:Uncharacterized protein n=1 Tax=Schistosoma margrebowiei TaxID=48269 RepID=A0A3P8H9A8_9TREM|nr:unnamed protein product [Schistosoma margrebowiei]